jgi:hypothetical protein
MTFRRSLRSRDTDTPAYSFSGNVAGGPFSRGDRHERR